MAFTAALAERFKITNATGAMVEITAYLTKLEGPKMAAQTKEISALGDKVKSFVRTQVDPGSFSMDGLFDPLIGTLLFNLGTASSVAFEWYPQGSATGLQKWTGNALVTTYSGAGGGIDDAATFSADLQVSGTVTIATL